MSDKKMKVIDRRMFTPNGELRDEYRASVDPDRAPEPAPPRPAPPAVEPAAPARLEQPAAPAAEPSPPPVDDDPDAPQFGDLLGLLAQTGAAYIQQARSTASPDLMQMARLHVDLLGVLEKKTAGNLTPDESQMLLDVKRQLGLALG